MIKQLIYRLSTKLQRPTIAGIDALHKRLDAIDSVQAQLSQALEGMEKYNSSKLSLMSEQIEQNLDISKSERDRIDFLHEQLIAARDTIGYKKAFDKNPLVTVRIATYNKADELLDVCLPSVLGQTYKNIEIIIVGDHCTDDTEARLKKLKDPRISFVNLPFRSIYPDNKNFRWMVAGSPGMNMGAEMARGSWIAPLDDDDTFTTDHISKLVSLAQEKKAELVYGSLIQKIGDEENLIYSFPPELGAFSFQAAIYPKALDFFKYDQQSWVMREPGDWNLCRRMLLAGVRVASTNDVVGHLNVEHISNKKHYKEDANQ